MTTSAQSRYCTFLVDGLLLGVDVLKVQEVIRYQEMTRVPGAARVVSGLINLRGQLVTALDLRRRLSLDERPEGRRPMNVVVRTDDGATSLLVDDIGDVIAVDGSTFERPPETVDVPIREMVTGVHKLEGRLLLVLDVDALVATSVGATQDRDEH